MVTLCKKSMGRHTEERARELERSRMFFSLRTRANAAIRSLGTKGPSDPLETNDAGYLVFFTRLVDELEKAAKELDKMLDEGCQDLLY